MNQDFLLLIRDVAILFPAFLAVFTFRGFARAMVAKWMGDRTAVDSGFATLNPLAYVDVAGLSIILLVVFVLGALLGGGQIPRSMLLILLIFMGVRWAYTVPFEISNFRNLKWGALLTILASPLGCFLLSFIFLYVQRYLPLANLSGEITTSLLSIVEAGTDLAIYFGVLELLPIPPFDGGQLLRVLLPYSKQGIVSWLEEHSLYIMLGLFFVPVVSDFFFIFIQMLGFGIKALLLIFVF